MGTGIGTGLLRHALMRSVEGANLVGGPALLVNALNEEAALFWRKQTGAARAVLTSKRFRGNAY